MTSWFAFRQAVFVMIFKRREVFSRSEYLKASASNPHFSSRRHCSVYFPERLEASSPCDSFITPSHGSKSTAHTLVIGAAATLRATRALTLNILLK